MMHFFPTFCPQQIFYPLFLNKDGKSKLSKLNYRYRQYASLIKTVLLESQCLQSYEGILDIFRPKFKEDHYNLRGPG